jgi:protein-tyrosine-phosphatase
MNVLFVCEDNCALSVMAEAILRAVAPSRFTAFSAGCFPGPALNADAVELLERHHISAQHLAPKSLHAFRTSAQAGVDFIITLGDVAADEDFVGWPGDPFVAHWTVEDDSTGEADEAWRNSFWTLMRRIKLLTSLPHGNLSRRQLERRAVRLEPSYL